MGSNSYLKRCCPACNAEYIGTTEVSSEVRAEDKDYDFLVPYWNGFFKEKIFFSYASCKECNLLYTPIFYNEDQLGRLYAQMPPNMDVVPVDALRRTQYEYFIELRNYSDLGGGYLEVGPDVGIFTKNCAVEGKFSKYWLFEPNKAVAKELGITVAGKEFSIIEDMFGFNSVPDDSIGVAVMIQVLDHLLDPISTLTELHKKLDKNAKLLLVTHNEKSILRKILGWKWPAFCLQHPQIYNPASIAKILESSGYEINSIKRSKNYFEFSFLVKHLLWAFGIKLVTLPRFMNFTIGLRLGNIITIATPRK